MQLVTLVSGDGVDVASGSLVIAADDTGALRTVVESASALQAMQRDAGDRLSAAETEAQERGYQAGLAQARAEAEAALALQRLEQSDAHARLIDAQRDETATLALQIVRKIAERLAPADVLAALADTAARECLADSPRSIRVHPDQVIAVRERLAALRRSSDDLSGQHSADRADTIASSAVPVSVIADESLTECECLLDTADGSLQVDLDTQLAAIGTWWAGTPGD